eukprot:186779_1
MKHHNWKLLSVSLIIYALIYIYTTVLFRSKDLSIRKSMSIKHQKWQSKVNSTEKLQHNSIEWLTAIMEQRTTPPKKCNNNKDSNNTIYNPTHNWLPYYLRCNYKAKRDVNDYTFIMGIIFGVLSNELIYSHIFKAGGTTITIGIEKLQQDNKTSLTSFYSFSGSLSTKDIEYRVNNSKPFAFTFVRDPISRFLSAFFEYNRRVILVSDSDRGTVYIHQIQNEFEIKLSRYKTTEPMKLLRDVFINTMLRNSNYSNSFNINTYLNLHFVPNMLFLIDQTNKYSNFSYNFIGNMKEFNNDLPQIMEPFIRDEKLKNNSYSLMQTYFIRKHHRTNNYSEYSSRTNFQEHVSDRKKNRLNKFNINESMLDDVDINNLCNVYWLDYICFPFDVPIQCNLTDIFIRHYGIDVEYKPCYTE